MRVKSLAEFFRKDQLFHTNFAVVPEIIQMLTESQIKKEVFNHGYLVLILGRNRETRLMMKTLLKLWHYRIIEARNIRETVQKSKSHSPDVILFDADSSSGDLPADLSGLRRNEQFKTVPIIVISSYTATEYRTSMLASGATVFFTKPLNYNHLETALKKCSAPENSAGDS